MLIFIDGERSERTFYLSFPDKEIDTWTGRFRI